MKTIILCGGKGQRMETSINQVPKPMVLVKGKPLIYHIMKQYAKFGFNEFILPLGYKGEVIKQYFVDFEWINNDFTKETYTDNFIYHTQNDKFKVTLVDTGLHTMTADRLKRVSKYIDTDTFMVTYSDGLSNINILDLINYHNKNGTVGTVTGIKNKSNYGLLEVDNGKATSFKEKPDESGIINGGYFVFKREFLKYLHKFNHSALEEGPLNSLINDGQLSVFLHEGTWISVDNHKDLLVANEVWEL